MALSFLEKLCIVLPILHTDTEVLGTLDLALCLWSPTLNSKPLNYFLVKDFTNLN